MKCGFLAGLVLLLLSMPPRVAAQETPTAAASGAVIGPEDGVTIVALNADDISKTWRVSSTGELTLPMVGKIHAAGKTTEELEAELTSKLSHYIREPEVTVYISEFRSETVTVEGAVEKPGRLQTEGQKTLLDVLMMAGGTKSPGLTLKVTRDSRYGVIPLPEARKDLDGTSSSAELPVRDVLDAGTPAANLVMQPNDVVYVSTDERLVYIMGEVNHTGAVELVTKDSISIVQVLAAAGGMTKVAAPGKTTILRRDSEGRYSPIGYVDLKKVLAGKAQDRILLTGDIVVVPSSNAKFYAQALLMAATTSGVTSSFYILSKY